MRDHRREHRSAYFVLRRSYPNTTSSSRLPEDFHGKTALERRRESVLTQSLRRRQDCHKSIMGKSAIERRLEGVIMAAIIAI